MRTQHTLRQYCKEYQRNKILNTLLVISLTVMISSVSLLVDLLLDLGPLPNGFELKTPGIDSYSSRPGTTRDKPNS